MQRIKKILMREVFPAIALKRFSSYRADTIFVMHKVQREITKKV